jgi:hypothetical protein
MATTKRERQKAAVLEQVTADHDDHVDVDGSGHDDDHRREADRLLARHRPVARRRLGQGSHDRRAAWGSPDQG